MYYYNVVIGAYYQTMMKQQKYDPCRMYASNKLFSSTWLCLEDLIQPKNWKILNSGENIILQKKLKLLSMKNVSLWLKTDNSWWWNSLNFHSASFYVYELKFWARVVKFIPSSGCVPDLFPFTAGENSSEEFLSLNVTYSTKYYLWGGSQMFKYQMYMYSDE